MSKEILIRYGERKLIVETFHTTYPTVIDALRYKTNSILAKRIRHFAIHTLHGVVTDNH